MATKWGKLIDEAAAKDRAGVIKAAKSGLDYSYEDEDGRVIKEPSTRPLFEAGFSALAQAAQDNSASRGKSVAHSLNVIITRLSAKPVVNLADLADRVRQLEEGN